ncbi:MAG: hypothetical protein ACR2OO_17235 [Thermomicrobiales bacterium]
MSQRNPKVVVGHNDTMPQVLERLRASSGRAATIAIPASSSLFLTASEFRALKAASEQARIDLTVETDDRLRRQLAAMFDLSVVDLLPGAVPALIEVAPSPGRPAGRIPPVADRTATPKGLAPPPPKSQPIAAETPPDAADSASGEDSEESKPDVPQRRLGPAEPAPDSEPESAVVPRRAITRRAAGIAAGVLVLLVAVALAAAYLLQSATVTLTVKRQPVGSDLIYSVVGPGVTGPSGAAFQIQATPVTFEVPFRTSMAVTGVARVPDGVATGKIQVRNTNPDPVELAAGATFADFNGVQFAIAKKVKIPGADAKSKAPGKGEAEVKAAQGGESGNHDVGTLSAQLQPGVYGINRQAAISGGSDKKFPSVAQADIDALTAQANQQLPDLARTVTLPDGRVVLAASVQPGAVQLTTDHKVGDQAANVAIDAKMTVTALAYQPSDASSQARAKFLQDLGGTAPAGYAVDPASLSIAAPVQVNGQPASAQFRLSATALAMASLSDGDKAVIAKALAGHGVDDAEAYLRILPQVASASIASSPGFLPKRIPGDSGRIEVTVR